MKKALQKTYYIYMAATLGVYLLQLCSLLLCQFVLKESGDVWFFRIIEGNVFITVLTIFIPIPFVLGAVCLAFSITRKEVKDIIGVAVLSVLYVLVWICNIAMLVWASGF